MAEKHATVEEPMTPAESAESWVDCSAWTSEVEPPRGTSFKNESIKAGDNITINSTQPPALATWPTVRPDRGIVLEPTALPLWRTWSAEIVFSALSLVFFFVVVVVLRVFDQQPLPGFPINITLNTLIAFFITLSKACYMLPVTRAISQWKWNIYQSTPQGEPLAHFQILDSASRGVWGSLGLLKSLDARRIVSLGALISVVSVVISPISQQLITYPSRVVASSGYASVPYTRSFGDDDGGLNNALLTGMQSDISKPVEHAPALCSSGNCTFDNYSSLGLGVDVRDVTSHLKIHALPNSTWKDWSLGFWLRGIRPAGTTAYNASLPNGISMVTPVSYSYIMWPSNISLAFNEDDESNFSTLGHMFLIYCTAGNVSYRGYDRTNEDMWTFRALEVRIYMAVNTYQTEVIDGNSSTRLLSSSTKPLVVEGNRPLNDVDNCTYTADSPIVCDTERIPFAQAQTTLADPGSNDPSATGGNFTINRKGAARLLQSLYKWAMDFTAWGGSPDDYLASCSPISTVVLPAIYGNDYSITSPDEQLENISRYFEGIAISASNGMRTASGSNYLQGTAFQPETYVHVRWGWIAFPAAEILLCYVFLLATMIMTRRCRAPVLKDSEIATLLASTEDIRSVLGSVQDMTDAEKQARSERVRLVDGRLECLG